MLKLEFLCKYFEYETAVKIKCFFFNYFTIYGLRLTFIRLIIGKLTIIANAEIHGSIVMTDKVGQVYNNVIIGGTND